MKTTKQQIAGVKLCEQRIKKGSAIPQPKGSKMNKVTELIDEIRIITGLKKNWLHRYQTNKGAHRVAIVYAVHDSRNKPTRSVNCTGPSVTLTSSEGATERCEAYRVLSKLHSMVQE